MPIEIYLNVVAVGILTGLVYGLMALGLSVIYGVIRIVNFAHGEMMTMAMYAAVVLFGAFKLDPLAMALPIAGAMFVFGYGLQRAVINPFVARPEHTQFMLMAAVAMIMVNGLLMIFGPNARNALVDYSLDSFAFGPFVIDATRIYAAAGALVLSTALFAFFRFAAAGRAIRACADNHLGALVVGLDVKKLYAVTFGLGAACVGAAGAMLTVVIDVTPVIGPSFTLLAFVIVIIGGLGSMAGALLGGILIGVAEAVGGLIAVPSAKGMFAFGLLVLVMLFRPQGLLGKRA